MSNKNPTLRKIDSFERTEKKERIHKVLIRHTVCFMRFSEPLLRKTERKERDIKEGKICPIL